MGYGMFIDIGLLLIVIGVVLIIIEIMTPGFFIAVPGTILLIYGVLIVLFPWLLEIPWVPWLMLLLAFPIGYSTYLIYRRLSPPSCPVTESYEGLIGKTGIVIERVEPDSLTGKVRIGTEIWSATSKYVIEPGEKVVVVGVEGVHLIVRPLSRKE